MRAPPSALLAWVASAVSAGSRVTGIRPLRPGGAPWLLRIEGATFSTDVVLKTGTVNHAPDRERFTTELAALELGRQFGLPVPRPVAANLDGGVAGRIALVLTALPGSSRVPATATKARLRSLGAAAATIHRVHRTPQLGLPLRTRPVAGVLVGRPRPAGAGALLEPTARLVAAAPAPARTTVFVHGDFWQGNTLWQADKLVGLIDWEYAGAGPYGVDLGSLRCDVALMYGVPAAADVLDGWQDAMGQEAADVAYWDLVGALNTPVDIGDWLPTIRAQGRADLDRATLLERLNAFHRAALDRYHRG